MASIRRVVKGFSRQAKPVSDEALKFVYKKYDRSHKKKKGQDMKKTAKEILIGGKADDKPDSKYDKNQLDMGKKVEEEHVGKDEPQAAKEIAKDHLEENPKYYSKLKKMEEGFKKSASFGSHIAEMAGLGILAVPTIQEMRGKKVSAKAKHTAELAGLGTLAIPSAVEMGKNIASKSKPYLMKMLKGFKK